jgi:oxygen-independent coproporphyrinogen-3 oxidase
MVVADVCVEARRKKQDNPIRTTRRAIGLLRFRWDKVGGCPATGRTPSAGYGFGETAPDGRLRVTRAGFPVLDAVVADLAA